jgi:hypothetical protein
LHKAGPARPLHADHGSITQLVSRRATIPGVFETVGWLEGKMLVEDAFASSLAALARPHPALSGLAPARIPTVAWTSQKKT